MNRAFLFLVLFFFSKLANAEVLVLESSVSVSSLGGIEAFTRSTVQKIGQRIVLNLDKDTDGMDKYIECAEVAELSGAFICNAFYQSDMNDTFTRMGCFMGASKDFATGILVSNTSLVLKNLKKIIGGHNLPGQIILDFFNKLTTVNDQGLLITSREEAFYKGFMQHPKIKDLGSKFYVIGTSSQNSKPAKDVVSHEIYHAQYGLNEKYHEVVNDFWKTQVIEEDQNRIKETLGHVYSTSEHILLDEFQAYLLQTNAEKSLLRDFVKKYAGPLRQALADRNVAPITIPASTAAAHPK